ncbi:hypothetical protein G7046_g912 [Stylonectria norvegica]|nr:hypothetical protein G7046_g912 [Stylonectria norvegica]
MILCQGEGRPDMYGLGIRIAFYIQWIGAIIVEGLDEQDLPDIQLVGFLQSTAVTIALFAQVAGNHRVQPIDIYLALVLSMGIFIFMVPIYVWRMLTCFNKHLDPLRGSKETQSSFFKLCNFVLLLSNAGIGVWYYTTYLPDPARDCEQYGFFFNKVELGDKGYIAFSSIFYLCIIIVCIGVVLVMAGWEADFGHKRRKKVKYATESALPKPKSLLTLCRKIDMIVLHQFRFLTSLIVYAVLITSIELPILWNGLQNVMSVESAAQTIPLFLSLGFTVRVLFLHWVNADGDDTSENSSVRVRQESHVSSVDIRDVPSSPSRVFMSPA